MDIINQEVGTNDLEVTRRTRGTSRITDSVGGRPWYRLNPPTAPSFRAALPRVMTVQAYVAAGTFLLLPVLTWAHPSPFRLQAAAHGLAALLIVVSGSYLGHLAYPLARGARGAIADVTRWTKLCLTLSVLAVVSGNWVYMPYRGQNGARERLLATAPIFHKVLMEFKEFVSLFPVPILGAVCFMLWYYKDELAERKDLAMPIAALLMLNWIFVVLSMVLGLGIAKVQFV